MKTKYALCLLTTLLLTACASGGGGGNASESLSPNNNSQTQQPQNPTNPDTGNSQTPQNPTPPDAGDSQQPQNPIPPTTGTGRALELITETDSSVRTKLHDLDGGTFSEAITVDGVTINVYKRYPGSSFQIVYVNTDGSSRTAYYNTGSKGSIYLYYNGDDPTPVDEIPTSGIANYRGQALLYSSALRYDDDAAYDDKKLSHEGRALFNVDFAQKSLTGQLSIDASIINRRTIERATIDINGQISGNSFTGTATSSIDARPATVEGKFYGANAQELAGMAQSTQGNTFREDDWLAIFTATKQ